MTDDGLPGHVPRLGCRSPEPELEFADLLAGLSQGDGGTRSRTEGLGPDWDPGSVQRRQAALVAQIGGPRRGRRRCWRRVLGWAATGTCVVLPFEMVGANTLRLMGAVAAKCDEHGEERYEAQVLTDALPTFPPGCWKVQFFRLLVKCRLLRNKIDPRLLF